MLDKELLESKVKEIVNEFRKEGLESQLCEDLTESIMDSIDYYAQYEESVSPFDLPIEEQGYRILES